MLNIGFIGTGNFTDFHCNILSKIEDVQVKAFCGTSLEKAELAAARWSGAWAYVNAEQMLDNASLDAVYICVPPMAHGEYEQLLVERNIPFFIEKPLGLDLDLPQSISKQVSSKKLITSVGYHFRYMDSTSRAIQTLQDRSIGMALGYFMGGMPMIPWWRKQEGSGGQFIEQTSHIVDLLRYTLGEVEEVYAVYANRVMQAKVEGVSVADVGSVTMKLVSGAIATVSNTCILPEGFKVGLDIYTDQGVLQLTPGGMKEVNKARTTEYKNIANAYALENEAFLHAVKTGDRSKILSPYDDSVKTQKITIAALQSAKSGVSIKI